MNVKSNLKKRMTDLLYCDMLKQIMQSVKKKGEKRKKFSSE
jgi:hypothetical protein